MNRTHRRPDAAGFTLIELMVVLALSVIVLAVAVPSFREYLAKQRVEGAMSELGTDLQYARSEAVARNADVRVTFGTNCYVIHTQPTGATATCSQNDGTASVFTGGAVEIKTTKVRTGPATISPENSLNWIQFEPVRGGASWDGSAASAASVSVNSAAGSGAWQLRASVNTAVGRLHICSPNGSMKGYKTC